MDQWFEQDNVEGQGGIAMTEESLLSREDLAREDPFIGTTEKGTGRLSAVCHFFCFFSGH